MKLWCRADSHSGYLCDFNVYCGKDKGGVENGLGYAAVTDLRRRPGVFMGNTIKYTLTTFSHLLIRLKISSNKTLSCGTVRAGRMNFPKELFNKETTKNMTRGDMDWRAKGPTSIVPWMEKKPVYVAGTIAGAPNENISTVKDGRRMESRVKFPALKLLSSTTSLWVVLTEMTRSNPTIPQLVHKEKVDKIVF